MATQKTMLIAQQLYEGIQIKGEGTVGLVSYIRTDSFRLQLKHIALRKLGNDFIFFFFALIVNL